MSYPYPQNRHKDRRDKGDQPYKDAKESMRENEAELQENTDQNPDLGSGLSDEEQTALQEEAAEQRLAEVGKEEDRDSES